MFVVKKSNPGKPIIISDNNRGKNGMLNNNISRDGWRLATEEEIKKYYPEYKAPAKKIKPKAEAKKEEPKDK